VKTKIKKTNEKKTGNKSGILIDAFGGLWMNVEHLSTGR
jgi:hypothetical protein